MSATPCLRFVEPSDNCGDLRCRGCGGSRADHEGRTLPAPSRLPTPEEMAATLYPPVTFDAASVERQDHRRRCAVRTIVARDADILARLDAGMTLDALRAELRGAP